MVSYIERFKAHYESLGCEVDTLLLSQTQNDNLIRSKIFSSNIIYIGGGNTARMMRIFKRNKVNEYLLKAYEKGIFIEFNGKRTEFNEQQTQELIDSKVQFIIGSDAHSAERIGEFSIPLNYIKKNNIPLERIVNLEEKND